MYIYQKSGLKHDAIYEQKQLEGYFNAIAFLQDKFNNATVSDLESFRYQLFEFNGSNYNKILEYYQPDYLDFRELENAINHEGTIHIHGERYRFVANYMEEGAFEMVDEQGNRTFFQFDELNNVNLFCVYRCL